MKKNLTIVVVIGIMILSTVVAGCSPTKQISDAISPTPTEALPEPTQEKESPTDIPKLPTNTPQPVAADLVLTGDQGFIQESIAGVFLFSVENPNAGYAIENSEYQIVIYDATNKILDTESSYITVVLPQEKMFVASEFYLEEGQIADHIEVQLQSGQPEEIDLSGAVFTVEQVVFSPDDYFPQISGVVNNQLSKNISDMKVTAVAFDQQGKVIGGGYTYLNFLAPNGKSAVDVSVKIDQTPASVELFPTLSGLSVFSADESSEGGLVLLDYGYTQDSNAAGVTFLIQNTSASSAIDSSEYRVEAYDEAGNVLDTDEGYINLVFPGERQAVYSDLFLPDGSTLAKVVVQINQGTHEASPYLKNPFTPDLIRYQPDDYFNSVTAIITNSEPKAIEDLKVVAVGFDDAGKIIGGGYTYLDFVPGQGQSGVSVSYEGNQAPTTIEVFPSLSGLSSLGSTNQEATIELIDFGFGIDGSSAGVGFLMRNTSTTSAIESTRYQVTAYDLEGFVIDTDSGYIDVIYPGLTIAGYGDLSLPSGMTLDRVEVQLLSGGSVAPPTPDYPFSTEAVNFIAGSYSSKVTGVVKSTLAKDINDIKVYAIAYDASDKIIGGGYTYVDFVPANGQSAVEVQVTVGGAPARVELYPSFSSLSDLSD